MTERPFPGLLCELCCEEAIAILKAYEDRRQFAGLDMHRAIPLCPTHSSRLTEEVA